MWLSACTLQFALAPAGVDVTVVELPPLTQPADVCISLPALEAAAHAPAYRRVAADHCHARCVLPGPPLHRRAPARCPRSSMRMAPLARASTARNSCRSGCTRAATGSRVRFEDFSLDGHGRAARPHAAAGCGHRRFRLHRLRLSPAGHSLWRRGCARSPCGAAFDATPPRALEVQLDEQRGIAALLLDGGQPHRR